MMDIRMGLAEYTDLPQLRALWQEAFGDSESYMDLYFDHRFEPGETYVLRENGDVASMMTAMRVSLWTDKEKINGRYIYAVATRKSCRGKGYAKMLDRFMVSDLRKMGVRFTCLVPAENSLHEFYAAQGYAEIFPRYIGILSRSEQRRDADLQHCPFPLFASMRTHFLKQIAEKKAALYHPENELSYIYEELHACGGLAVTFMEGDILRYAAVTLPEEEDTLVLLETDGDPLFAADLLMQRLDKQNARIYHPFPFPGGSRVPYGMGRSLDGTASLPMGYMALMLD